MGEELNGFVFIGVDECEWVPLGNGIIKTFDPSFDAAVDVPVYPRFDEPEIQTEIKMGSHCIVRLKRILFGWKAKGPMRMRNVWKAARLRGRI